MGYGDYAGRGLYRLPQTREPAAAHFRRMGRSVSLPPVNEDETAEAISPRFEIYRADQVMITSTRLSGGDWHWQLVDRNAVVLMDVGGYENERECREAIAILQGQAGTAMLPGN